MTKAKTTSRPANDAAQPKTVPSTAAANAKRPRSKATTASAAVAAPAAKSTLTETPITHATPAAPSKSPRQTKAALLRARLAKPGGVSLAALIELTGWQAHTLRAALSGLRKEGLTLTRRREGDDTIYAIGSAVADTSLPAEGTA
jgi:Protein of unknown function (DUF3489)